MISPTKLKASYCLRLANGQGWNIVATEEVKLWVEKLASIMELNTCKADGYPKLVFVQREPSKGEFENPIDRLDQSTQGNIPKDGWRVHRLGVLRLWYHDHVQDVICETEPDKNHDLDIIRMWHATHPIYQRAQKLGGLPFHAALIERNGKGILLAGHGGAGKSTCCQYLPHSWHVLCDDETLVVLNDQKEYFAHPFPTWSDYLWKRSERTWNVQQNLPLSAIFFLKQADTDEAVPIGQGEAAIFINQLAMDICQRNWRGLEQVEERALRKKLFDHACELGKAVPAYKLKISLKGRFWEEIEAALEC